MALASELSSVLSSFLETAPPKFVEPIVAANTNFQSTFDRTKAIQPGATLPPFQLSDALGKQIRSDELLAKSPTLITFYRGDWCPFCNLALNALQKHLGEFKAKGVTLVAISPELPDTSLTTIQKHELKFTVLSDVGNKYAKELGILNEQPAELRPVFKELGHDLKSRNGDDSFAVPVPTTILVDRNGVVRNVFVEPDYTKRLEPETALEWVDAL